MSLVRTLVGAAFALLALALPAANAGDVAPGTRFKVDRENLPPPFASRSAANPPVYAAPRAGTTLRAPQGFTVNIFADSLNDARWLAVAPNGDVFLAESGAGQVTLLRDTDADGYADVKTAFARGFNDPHGLALRQGWLYVGDTEAVWRVPYRPGATKSAAPPERVTAEGALGGGGGHWTRNIAFSPDGKRFYVAIGSASNLDEDPSPRASVQEFSADGKNQRPFATGLRNPVGIAFYPGTGDLYVVVNERDGLGDGLVPDYLTRVEDGGFYGWPYAYLGPHPQPGFADKRPELVAATIVPDQLFLSHSAPLGLAFYDGDQFPDDYRGDAFVALHGSWNAANPQGYFVARVPFAKGRPQGHYEAFVSGFWIEGKETAGVRGRPVGLAVAADGSLLIADDIGNKVWRVSYGK